MPAASRSRHSRCSSPDSPGRSDRRASRAGRPVRDPATEQCSIVNDMVSADAYWVANGTDTAPPDWKNSTFQVGNLAMVRTTGVTNHITFPWAAANNYQLPADPPDQPFFADDEAAGEAYLALYHYHPNPASLQPLRDRVAAEDASVRAATTRTGTTSTR